MGLGENRAVEALLMREAAQRRKTCAAERKAWEAAGTTEVKDRRPRECRVQRPSRSGVGLQGDDGWGGNGWNGGNRQAPTAKLAQNGPK